MTTITSAAPAIGSTTCIYHSNHRGMTPLNQTYRTHPEDRSTAETDEVSGPVPGPATESGPARDHDRRIALYRLGGAILIAVLGLTLPGLRDAGPVTVLTITLPVILVNTAMLGKLGRRESFRRLAALSDLVLTGVLVLFLPSGFAVSLMVIIGLVPLYTFWLGKRTATEITAFGIVLFSSLGALAEVDNWPVQIMSFGVVALTLTHATAAALEAVRSRSARLDSLAIGTDAILWESDDPRRRTVVGGQVDRVLGVTIDQSDDVDPISGHVHPDDLEIIGRAYETLDMMTGRSEAENPWPATTVSVAYRILDEDGAVRHLHERITTSRDDRGDSIHRGVITDETAMIAAENASRSFDEFVTRIATAMLVLELEPAPDGTGDHIDPTLYVVAANTAAVDLFDGYTDDLVGGPFDSRLGIEDDLLDRLMATIEDGREHPTTVLQLPFSESIYSVRTVSLPRRRVGVMLDDVTAFARKTEALQRKATHDDLTGLPNRAQFADQLEAAIRACNSAGDSTTVAVLMIDLNKFKAVNDTYGHEYGDKLLVEVARRLTRNVRGCDTISRLGGDEFAAIVRSTDIEKSAQDVGERIEQLIRQPFQIMGQTLSIGASIGIAVRRQSLLSARTLVRDADHAMYRAKAAGGGIIHHDGRPTGRGTTIEQRDPTTSAR